MYDVNSLSDATSKPSAASINTIRADGGVKASWRRDCDVTRLVSLEERGGWRAKFPTPDPAIAPDVEVVLINTGGGILGGDRARFAFEVGAGARVTMATQSAERIYRTLGPTSEICTAIQLGCGARGHWMPQETILFNQASLRRSLTVNMPASATLLAVEALVFGRTAMGEIIRGGSLRDDWRVYRDQQLVFAEATRLDGDMGQTLEHNAVGAGATAAATLLYVAPDAEARRDGARDALGTPRGRAAVSAWNGFLVARFLATSSADLRADIGRVATYLSGQPMPRVWNC
jgi:urease accessory protein